MLGLAARALALPASGYFATRSAVPLQLAEARPPRDLALPFDFAIAMAES